MYFRFRFWLIYRRCRFLPIYRHRHGHGIMHRRTKSNFHPYRSMHGGVMTSYRFFKMEAIEPYISTSGFDIKDGTRFGMLKSVYTPDFHEISQSTAELLLLPFLETDVCHIGILFPVSLLSYSPSSAWQFAMCAKFHSNRLTHRSVMTSYGFFQHGGYRVEDLLPVHF